MEENPFRRTERQQAADGWASICAGTRNPLKLWESIYSRERMTVEKPVLGGIVILMQPFAYLVEVGTRESLGAELETIQRAESIVRKRGLPGKDEETISRLVAIAGNLKKSIQAAACAEELLQKHGWKFAPETNKVCEVAKRKGAELLPRIIQRLGIEYGTGAGGREKIKNELSPYFEDLDAGPRGNIARALENLKR